MQSFEAGKPSVFRFANCLSKQFQESNLADLEIAGRLIGDEHPPVVIAEIGINHEGPLI